jgi:hypothetical protein
MHVLEIDLSSGFLSDNDSGEDVRRQRIATIAAVLVDAQPDLDDDLDVIRALYARGLTCKDWNYLLEDAIAMAREARQ